MVKYTNILIGLVLFSLFITLMFSMAGSIGTTYGSTSAENFTKLSGEYGVYITEEGTNANSTLRKIESKLGNSTNPISVGADILVAAVDGVKLMFGSVLTLNKVGDQVVEDSNGMINPLFKTAAASIIVIILVIIVISMLMRMKPET